jgi:hypothetical protein
MADREKNPNNVHILHAASEIARDAAEPIPEPEEILIIELKWEIDDYVDEIMDLIMEVSEIRNAGDGSPLTAENASKIRALRKKMDPLYARIEACHKRIAIISSLFDVCPNFDQHESED